MPREHWAMAGSAAEWSRQDPSCSGSARGEVKWSRQAKQQKNTFCLFCLRENFLFSICSLDFIAKGNLPECFCSCIDILYNFRIQMGSHYAYYSQPCLFYLNTRSWAYFHYHSVQGYFSFKDHCNHFSAFWLRSCVGPLYMIPLCRCILQADLFSAVTGGMHIIVSTHPFRCVCT